jgi:hypothetical protein
MMKHALKYGRLLALVATGVFCFSLSVPLLAQSTTTHFSFIGASGEVQFTFAPDSCTTVNGDIFVAASGSQGNSANAPPFAFASLFTLNSCTNPPTATFELGSTSTFQFASQGGNGTDTPRVVMASGQIPMTNAAGVQVDVLSFQLTLNRVGSIVYELDGDSRSTYPTGSPLVISHYANTVSLASATLTASTQSQGALLPLSVLNAIVQNSKGHEVDVTRR